MEMMAADNAPNASLPNTLNMIWRIACLRRDDNLPAHELALAIVSLYGQVNRAAALGRTAPAIFARAVCACIENPKIRQVLTALLAHPFARGFPSAAFFVEVSTIRSGVSKTWIL